MFPVAGREAATDRLADLWLSVRHRFAKTKSKITVECGFVVIANEGLITVLTDAKQWSRR